jgi:hypothetical protein
VCYPSSNLTPVHHTGIRTFTCKRTQMHTYFYTNTHIHTHTNTHTHTHTHTHMCTRSAPAVLNRGYHSIDTVDLAIRAPASTSKRQHPAPVSLDIENSSPFKHLTTQPAPRPAAPHTGKVGQNHIHIRCIHTVYLAGKPPNIRSFTV